TASSTPITYCPQPIVQPKDSCGPAKRKTFARLGIVVPRNNVANTTLIINPGNVLHTLITSSGKIPFVQKELLSVNRPSILPNTSGPTSSATKPPIIEDSRNKFCSQFVLTRSHLPIKRKIPK